MYFFYFGGKRKSRNCELYFPIQDENKWDLQYNSDIFYSKLYINKYLFFIYEIRSEKTSCSKLFRIKWLRYLSNRSICDLYATIMLKKMEFIFQHWYLFLIWERERGGNLQRNYKEFVFCNASRHVKKISKPKVI